MEVIALKQKPLIRSHRESLIPCITLYYGKRAIYDCGVFQPRRVPCYLLIRHSCIHSFIRVTHWTHSSQGIGSNYLHACHPIGDSNSQWELQLPRRIHDARMRKNAKLPSRKIFLKRDSERERESVCNVFFFASRARFLDLSFMSFLLSLSLKTSQLCSYPAAFWPTHPHDPGVSFLPNLLDSIECMGWKIRGQGSSFEGND